MKLSTFPLVIAIFVTVFVAGCGSSSPTATPTPMPPTPTPVPPTPTPIAFTAPEIVSDYLVGARAIAVDSFETLDVASWTYTAGSVTTSLGEAQVTGVTDWGSHLYSATPVPEGTAILLRFRTDVDAEFGIYVESGTWGSGDYKRFGTYGPYPETNVFRGVDSEPRQEFDGVLSILPEVWYDLMIAIGPGGEFVALIWDSADSSQNLVYQRVVDVRWAGSSWLFGITANSGFVAVDDVTVLSFDSLSS